MTTVELTEEDLVDLAEIISPGTGLHVNPAGYSADVLRGIIARHAAGFSLNVGAIEDPHFRLPWVEELS